MYIFGTIMSEKNMKKLKVQHFRKFWRYSSSESSGMGLTKVAM